MLALSGGPKLMDDGLLQIDHLIKYFPVKAGFFSDQSGVVHAVDDISLSMRQGDSLGLVGESGCGKTTLGRLIVRLEDYDKGEISFGGKEISKISGGELKQYRREVQMIFQDPFESLNPRRTVQSILAQPFINFKLASGFDLKKKIVRLLDTVGLKPGEMYLSRYPHQFSGGQRQRIGIARAISLGPRLIIADEPVSALDISVRAQILNLLKELQGKNGFSYLFISHDLSVIRSMCNRVAVMYLGKIVETGETEEIFSGPLHPYTVALLAATPISDPVKARSKKRRVIMGDVPSAVNPPTGCRFRTRCPYQVPRCTEEEPCLREYTIGHRGACHRTGEIEFL
jgi:oligopeptide transport system ATP-binding protein